MKNIRDDLAKAGTILDRVDERLDDMAAELQADGDPLPSGFDELREGVEEFGSALDEIHKVVAALMPEARRWRIFLASEGGIVYINGLDEIDTVPLDLAAMLVHGRVPVGRLDDLGACVRFNLPKAAVMLQKSLVGALARDTYILGDKTPELEEVKGKEDGGTP
jgi:hypothetical protein